MTRVHSVSGRVPDVSVVEDVNGSDGGGVRLRTFRTLRTLRPTSTAGVGSIT